MGSYDVIVYAIQSDGDVGTRTVKFKAGGAVVQLCIQRGIVVFYLRKEQPFVGFVRIGVIKFRTK